MQLERFSDVAAFSQSAEGFLLAHEAEHCLMLGICATLLRAPDPDAPPPYLATVAHEGEIVIAALRTPPYNLVLSLVSRTHLSPLPSPTRGGEPQAELAMALLVDDLRALDHGNLSGVIGPTSESHAFAERWQRETGHTYHVGVKERLYRLERVTPVTGVPGGLCRAHEGDRELLVRWSVAFNREALGEREVLDAESLVENALTSPVRRLYLWEDGEPVTMVGCGGPTPHGMRIGPVYTPPERRRKGYASAGTAAVSQLLLEEGRQFVFLFTDLANPTSNHIYQEIGYRPVCDVDVYEFDATPTDKE
jgi:predicted GNAT family acetyltransferase